MAIEKRGKRRIRCKKLASLTSEGDCPGLETYQSVWVVDRSKTGFCIASKKKIDTACFLTLRYDEGRREEYPAEFIWEHREKNMYYARLHITE